MIINKVNGRLLTTLEFIVDDVEVGHIRYWYTQKDITKSELLEELNVSENTRNMIDSFPADSLEGNSLYIHHLYVESDYRNLGYGRQIVEHLVNIEHTDLNQIVLAYDEQKPWLVDFYKDSLSPFTREKDNVLLFNLKGND